MVALCQHSCIFPSCVSFAAEHKAEHANDVDEHVPSTRASRQGKREHVTMKVTQRGTCLVSASCAISSAAHMQLLQTHNKKPKLTNKAPVLADGGTTLYCCVCVSCLHLSHTRVQRWRCVPSARRSPVARRTSSAQQIAQSKHHNWPLRCTTLHVQRRICLPISLCFSVSLVLGFSPFLYIS